MQTKKKTIKKDKNEKKIIGQNEQGNYTKEVRTG